MGLPVGRALAEEYTWEHDDELVYDKYSGPSGRMPFPE
jgi:hypothetical protein